MLSPLLLLLQTPVAVEVSSTPLAAPLQSLDASLALSTADPARIDFTLQWADEEARFELDRAIVRHSDYLLLVDRGEGRLEAAEPTALTYTGFSADGRFRGVVGYDGERLLANLRDVVTGDVLDVQVEDVPSGLATLTVQANATNVQPTTLSASVSDDLAVVEYAADVDYEAFVQLGSTIAASELHVLTILAGMNAEHWNDPNETDDPIAENLVTALVVRSTAPGPYTSNVPSTILSQVRDIWSGALSFVARDTVQLYTGRDLENLSATGYFNGLCNSLSQYSAVEQSQPNLFKQGGAQSYMLGIQWGVGACNGQPGCDLMCQNDTCGNDGTGFAPSTLSQLLAIKTMKACLDDQAQGPARSVPTINTVQSGPLDAVTPGLNEVFLIGNGMLGTTSVTVGGMPLDPETDGFVILNNQALRLSIGELPALGTATIEVTNPLGTATATIDVVPNKSPVVDLVGGYPQVFSPLDTAQVYVGAGLGDTVYLFASTSSTPSILPGLVSLDLGNNFSQLIQLGVYVVDATTGYVDFTAPLGNLPSGLEFYVQAATISAAAPVLPAPQTNVATGMVVY